MTREELEQWLKDEIEAYDGEDIEGRILTVEAGNPATAAQAKWLWRNGGIRIPAELDLQLIQR